jgi:hypothetical protein
MLGMPVGLHELAKLTQSLRLCRGPFSTGFFGCVPCDWVRGVCSDTLLVVGGASRQPRALGHEAPKAHGIFHYWGWPLRGTKNGTTGYMAAT